MLREVRGKLCAREEEVSRLQADLANLSRDRAQIEVGLR